MIVVSNTAPLNYLVLIGAADVLPQLFGSVIIPPAVQQELTHSRAPTAVRAWAEQPPEWLELRPAVLSADPSPAGLQIGEREAIALALEIGADLLLIDDSAGRLEAKRRGLRVAGTVGILDSAAERGLVDFGTAVERLRQTNFHLSDVVLRPFLERHAKRPSKGKGEAASGSEP